MKKQSLSLIVAFLFPLTMLATACEKKADHCFPEPLMVSAKTVVAGDRLQLSSDSAKCSLGYVEKPDYQVTLVTSDSMITNIGVIQANTDGHFVATVAIPKAAARGEATLLVKGSKFDDNPVDARAAYSVSILIQ